MKINLSVTFFLLILSFFSSCSADEREIVQSDITSFVLTKDDGTVFESSEFSFKIVSDSIFVTIPALESRTNLKTKISHTGKRIAPENGSVLDFSNPVQFTVFNTKGTERKYFAVVKYATPKNTMFIGGIRNYFALDSQKGSLKWSFQVPSGDFTYSTAFFHNNVLYVGCTDHYLYALNASNGRFLWKYKTNLGIESGVYVSDDTVYFGSGDDDFYALDATTGNLKWKFSTGFNVSSSPNVSGDTVYFASDDGNIYALDKRNGNFKWKYFANNIFERSGCSIVGNDLYVGNRNGNIYKINKNSGELIWKKLLGSSGEHSSPTISGGYLYTTDESDLYKIETSTGNIIWQKYNVKKYSSSPYVNEKYITVNSSSGDLTVINKSTGNIIWQKTIYSNSAEPISVNSFVYSGGGGTNNIYCYSEDDGKEIWKYPINSIDTSAPVIINNEGKLFYPSKSGAKD